MSNPDLTGLYDILDAERSCCARLLEVSELEQDSLVKNDVHNISGNTTKMQSALRELRELHDRRNHLVETVGRELDITSGDVTFHRIIDRVDETSADVLKNKLADLDQIGEALYRLNQQTIYLINFSMGLIDEQVERWSDLLTHGDGYSATGTKKSGHRSARIIEGKV